MQSNESQNDCFAVVSVNWNGHVKRLRLYPKDLWLTVPRSACVTKGDRVRFRDGKASVICRNGQAQFLPPYAHPEKLQLGSTVVEVLIKEITEPEEYEAYQSLSNSHYRGKAIYGRTARLIVRSFHPLHPEVLGYIELATPFYMNKARAEILNTSFRLDGIAWKAWKKSTMRKYIHLIVRIARCVVYPEFRGLGLGQILVKHAAQFARERWQVSGWKPLFLEISADMLKYVPFVEKAGMVYIGETEGNLKRVHKDMAYLLSNAKRVKSGEIVSEESCGIVDQQVARLDRALRLMEQEGLSKEELVRRLQRLSRDNVLRDFAFFHEIVSLPKPTYMMGLTEETDNFVRKRAKEIAPSNGHTPPSISLDPLTNPILLKNITLTFESQVRRTRQTHAIQQAFGISPDAIKTIVIRNLSMKIKPGSIVLIIGPSGSGKTTLLELLSKKETEKKAFRIEGELQLPKNYRPGIFQPIRSRKALIEVMDKRDVRSALYLMGLVGLSDAFIYLKRFEELSKGQQYRAMLAKLLSDRCNVWLIDEFCANLDPVTANVVAEKLQHTARQFGATLIVAAPHCEMFLTSLKPDLVLQLTSAWEHRIWDGQEFTKRVSQLRDGPAANGVPTLRLLPEFFSAVRRGDKRTTIRKGRKFLQSDLLLFQCGEEYLPVRVIKIIRKRFSKLTAEDARNDGFSSLSELQSNLRALYPDLQRNSIVTIIYFQLLCGEGAG
ncbi:GNAT family N-acetyltransferase [Candidatus Poribacteria bacterium]|nr:GNAT family N-acetyltransferase [Candidatus Poribacteria bacterium]